jgi:hypothetical protein
MTKAAARKEVGTEFSVVLLHHEQQLLDGSPIQLWNQSHEPHFSVISRSSRNGAFKSILLSL